MNTHVSPPKLFGGFGLLQFCVCTNPLERIQAASIFSNGKCYKAVRDTEYRSFR
jgi:hypothetical protein